MQRWKISIAYSEGDPPEVSIENPSHRTFGPYLVSGLSPAAALENDTRCLAQLQTSDNGARPSFSAQTGLSAHTIGQALFTLLFGRMRAQGAKVPSDNDAPDLGELWICSESDLHRHLPWSLLTDGAKDLEALGLAIRTSRELPGDEIQVDRPAVLWIETLPPGATLGLEEVQVLRYARQWWARPHEAVVTAHRWSEVERALAARSFDLIFFCGEVELAEGTLLLRLGDSRRPDRISAEQLAALITGRPARGGHARPLPSLFHLHATRGVLPAGLLEARFGDACEVLTWSEALPSESQPGEPVPPGASRPGEPITTGTSRPGGPALLLQKLLDEELEPAIAVMRAFPYPPELRHLRGCQGAYRSWKASVPRTGHYFSFERLARIDRTSQCITVIGTVQKWLQRRHARALAFAWQGRPVDGVRELHSRLPEELELNFKLHKDPFRVCAYHVSWPSDTGDWFKDELEEIYSSALDLSSVTDLGPLVARYQDADGILLYIGHTLVPDRLLTLDLLQKLFQWWHERFLRDLPPKVWPVLGLSFTAGDSDTERLKQLCPSKPGPGWAPEAAWAWRQMPPTWLEPLREVDADDLMRFFEQEGVPHHWRELSDFKTNEASRRELFQRCEQLIHDTHGIWTKVVDTLNGQA